MSVLPLSGRVAVVTGVSRRAGIGFAIAERLALMGADLFLHSFAPFDAAQPWGADDGGASAIAAAVRAAGGRVGQLEADFMDSGAPERVIAAAVEAFGHVDILIPNHAYSTPGTLEQMTEEQIDTHLLVNVRGSLLLVQAFAGQHDTRPGGRVILMTSGQYRDPMPGEVAYAASKGALHQITATLAAHLAPRAITVNAIDPGTTETGWATEAVYEEIRKAHPQGRWGRPEDAARLIGWLCTDDAAWVTGQIIGSRGGA